MLQHLHASALLVFCLPAAGHAAAMPVETLLATRTEQPALLDDANATSTLERLPPPGHAPTGPIDTGLPAPLVIKEGLNWTSGLGVQRAR
jgi:hypothetical protein